MPRVALSRGGRSRQGLLPAVRVFLDHLAAEFPEAVLI